MQPSRSGYGYGMTLSACLWLGLFPLLQGGTYSTLTYDKWKIMLFLTAVTLCCFLFDLLTGRKKASRSAPDGRPAAAGAFSSGRFLPFILCSALLLWTVLSCLFGGYGPDVWWLGEAVRYEGLVTRLCCFALFACFFFSRVNLKPVLFSAAAGVTVFLVIVLLQRAGGNPFGLFPAGRSYALNPEFQGTIGNVDMGTGYLLLLAGFFLYGFLSFAGPAVKSMRSGKNETEAKGRRLQEVLLSAVSLAGLGISVFLILTMDVQFGLIALAVLFVFTFLRFLPKKLRLPVLILLLVFVLLVIWFWPGQDGGLWEFHEILHGRTQLSFGSNRLAVWNYSLRMAMEKPVLGSGSGTFRSRFNRYLSDHSLTIPKKQDGKTLPDYFDNPHNEYISQLTDHGLPALLLFLAVLFAAVFRRREGWFPMLAPCSAAVLCYAVQAFFSFSVCIVAPMFWMLLALSFKE